MGMGVVHNMFGRMGMRLRGWREEAIKRGGGTRAWADGGVV